MGYYSEVARDINKIPEAIKFFEDQLIEARGEVKLKGNVERAAAEMPGIVEHRFNQLQEIEAILNYLNIELRRLRSSSKNILKITQRVCLAEMLRSMLTAKQTLLTMKRLLMSSITSSNKWLGLLKGLIRNSGK